MSDNSNITDRQRWYREEYLCSEHWESTRLGALTRASYRCQVCNTPNGPLDVHHRTYENIGQELPEDLIALCRTCHELFETNRRLPRTPSTRPAGTWRRSRVISAPSATAAPSATVITPAATPTPAVVNPSGWATLASVISIIAFQYGLGTFFYLYPATEGDGAALMIAVAVCVRCFVGLLAINDRCDDDSGLVKRTLIFALAWIPIGSWFALVYAGRSLARQRWGWPAGMFVLGAGLFLASMFIPPRLPSSYGLPVAAPMATATHAPPVEATLRPTVRPTVEVIPTVRPSPTRRPTQRPTATPACQLATGITTRQVGRTLCVYGNVYRSYETHEAFIVEFSRASGAFYLVAYDWVFPDLGSGDCVLAEGKIERLGSNPVMVVRDLYFCE